ncbi:aminotransferase class I/II-fold pyridoxal phosphate-dependent enzyme [Azospirillum doebereinerae]|uniref:Aminotransferase class I/II-fold pyridoxal phosphate-dependent enzyme n=1 Tax=Azospirillum doebereinerae TaxID=92933 RepID=A0A433JBI4_9PROT|nr:aminotransferase class I/II-fold pyridoxal phosphate-dependent enzyme [Azospirillum doebereinerae]MCG5243180.1 aminotransferase class I/II-fold pyridoxal phosphate-dependent enzyme [Azospirillum doebereinerae]RUQ73840.1 aminotransferase class I/II-fold pyridoxal phosphate-dependent enzyme [Azospirillum doebereinerae]
MVSADFSVHPGAVFAEAIGNDRLDLLTDYPFTRLANLLAGVTPRANTAPVMLSVGEPQHPPPALIDEALRANTAGWGKYPPVGGTPEFRAAAGDWLTRRYALPAGLFEPDRSLLPVSGTREALFMLALLAVPPRKAGRQPAVLMPNPFYAPYEGAAVLAGAEPVFLSGTRGTGFLPDLDALTPELLERTALFYLCTPANPQGAAASAAYLAKAIGLARQYGFVLAVDECYAEIYLDTPPVGALQVAAGLPRGENPWANILVFHSLSKRSSAAGLRSGFVAGDPVLIGRFSRLRSYANAGMPLPVVAASTALWRDEAHVEENRRLYRAKFAAAEAELQGRYGYYRPDGGFFLWLEVGDGEEAARRLWAEGALRVLPGAYLSRNNPGEANPGERFIRVALVQDAETIGRACAAIVRILG